MKKFYTLILLLGIFAGASNLAAQNMTDMRLNEILVENTDGFVDDYGCRSGWIELFNSSYGTVDIAGCYLTTDANNLKMYMIPKGDVLTKISPRQHVLFWADSAANRGTFHLGFNLNGATEVLFVASDGRTIIDRIKLPALEPNKSFGRKYDGQGVSEKAGIFYQSYRTNKVYNADMADKTTQNGWTALENPTPSTNNFGAEEISKSMMIAESDPYGIFLTITAMSVTFLALILLYFVFKNIGKFHIRKTSETAKKATASSSKKDARATSGEVSAETYAAIATAMHMYLIESEAHDYEDTVLTINKVSKSYSPWSSKIYTLRETPQLRK